MRKNETKKTATKKDTPSKRMEAYRRAFDRLLVRGRKANGKMNRGGREKC